MIEEILCNELAALLPVFPQAAPQGCPVPYLVYGINENDSDCLGGQTGGTVFDFRLQVFADAPIIAKTLGEEVLDKLKFLGPHSVARQTMHDSETDRYYRMLTFSALFDG